MIIDSHIHVWSEATDPRRDPIPWLPNQEPGRYRDITLTMVEAELTAAEVTGLVLVQAANELRHNEEMFAAAAASPRPVRVVGWLPLTDPDQTHRMLQQYAGRPELVGVRHRQVDTDDPGFLLQPEVAKSLELVAEAGLTLDVMPWPPGALQHVPEVARRHPTLTILIDMLGWPEVAERRMQPWTDQLAAAAAEPGVHVKVGGLYRVSGEDADPDSWRPYVSTAVELFGPERIMLGSNWPTMTAFGRSYTETIQALLSSFDELIEVERAQVTAGTAARIYRFDEDR